jgi:hypothetical protein
VPGAVRRKAEYAAQALLVGDTLQQLNHALSDGLRDGDVIVPETRRRILAAAEQTLRVRGPYRRGVSHGVGERAKGGQLELETLRPNFPLAVTSRLSRRVGG